MYKSTLKWEHFTDRTGDYSTHGRARGVFEIIPEITKRQQFQRVDLQDIVKNLEWQERGFRRRLELAKARKDENESKNVLETLCRIRGKIGSIRDFLKVIKSQQYAQIFLFCADQFLNQECLHALRGITARIIQGIESEVPGIDYEI